MDRRVCRLAFHHSQGHPTLLQLQMPQQFITQPKPLDASRNHMTQKI